ncbi:hypothetical protein [Helicobacter sp.]|uniref:hypothetical protein n=1 Tax=Helicobacter sp. TaxID=218 RepID=UPI0025B81270|nr:hypothetical protein [Helicobacter sp.]MCI5969109.1 hypothetical protein [Helicobacter sp.]
MQERLYRLKQDATFLSNCFDISLLQKIKSGAVEVCESESGFVCVEKKLGVDWLYYFLVAPYCFMLSEDLPIFTNLFYTDGIKVESFKRVLSEIGFKQQRENLMLMRTKAENMESKMDFSCGGGALLIMRKVAKKKR